MPRPEIRWRCCGCVDNGDNRCNGGVPSWGRTGPGVPPHTGGCDTHTGHGGVMPLLPYSPQLPVSVQGTSAVGAESATHANVAD